MSANIIPQRTQVFQPRAIGTAAMVLSCDVSGQTRLGALRQSGCMKLVFPRKRGPGTEAVLVNTAGGITGGDRLALDLTLKPGAALTLTTQAAERAYRAQPDEIGVFRSKVTIASGAKLHWLPQELILFDRCALSRRLDVDLEPDAQFLMVEPVVFGRKAMGEQLCHIHFQDRIRISRNGIPLYTDGLNLNGNVNSHLARAAVANGAGAMASLVLIRSDASRLIAPLRAALPAQAGVSLLSEDMLVIRQLASDAFDLRRTLVPILDFLTANTLPMSWRL